MGPMTVGRQDGPVHSIPTANVQHLRPGLSHRCNLDEPNRSFTGATPATERVISVLGDSGIPLLEEIELVIRIEEAWRLRPGDDLGRTAFQTTVAPALL